MGPAGGGLLVAKEDDHPNRRSDSNHADLVRLAQVLPTPPPLPEGAKGEDRGA